MRESAPILGRPQPELAYRADGPDCLVVVLKGTWTHRDPLPSLDGVKPEVGGLPNPRQLAFSTEGLETWDTALLTYVLAILQYARDEGWEVDPSGLPAGLKRLIELATVVPPVTTAAVQRERRSLLRIIGDAALAFANGTGRLMAFIGEAALSLARFATGQARFRRSDLWLFVEQAGVDALPIVSLLSLLQGMTMAYLGAAQLQMFGAQIYVANLIGLSMAAEVGAVMTAIIMAGRTGAAYAAQIGSMQVNQEIDALKTMGLNPIDFLVLPRMLSLIIMMPLLYLYANVLGMLGGAIIAVSILGVTLEQFFGQLFIAVPLSVFATGFIKSSVFGILVALSGCMHGISCGRSAAAVGDATTSSVVMAIVAIILGDGIFAVVAPPFPVGF